MRRVYSIAFCASHAPGISSKVRLAIGELQSESSQVMVLRLYLEPTCVHQISRNQVGGRANCRSCTARTSTTSLPQAKIEYGWKRTSTLLTSQRFDINNGPRNEIARSHYEKGSKTMADQNCAHAGCACKVEHGYGLSREDKNYCSDHCAQAGTERSGQCVCGHPDCETAGMTR
jgi:hypothetical protein